MIRAHLATFPARRAILADTIRSIAPQVDRLFLCLNDYDAIPAWLDGFANLHPMIPESDLKDTGKFAFDPQDDDLVFTIDDDILYPPDYVERTLRQAEAFDLSRSIVGYQANRWTFKKAQGRHGWKTFMFFKPCRRAERVDVLGTGTACMTGRAMPRLGDLAGAAGFVDIRFATWQMDRGREFWVLPRGADDLRRNLPEDLKATSLFHTVATSGRADLRAETRALLDRIGSRG
ncbi:hypothetical protein GIY56_08195 [Paracoccus sp. YIM 132242]|uniref:Glycosyltransferase family 2 protein n=1 Tax=Paracoccus lichenicola TaxID=2665644 RepID=A0A6L6HQE8_9RHOB|nr:hypothetical protein [Paracoccus lichenicola]MTE00265.1 hypothetical protein [Paracoccus lichenicola]